MKPELFGTHTPGDSWVHRTPAGAKILAVLLLSLIPLIIRSPWVTLGALMLSLTVLLASCVPMRRWLPLAWPVVLVLAAVVIYQGLRGRPDLMVVVPGNVLAALYLARALVLTTSGPDLLDALSRMLPERVALAVALMLRSIPQLLEAMGTVRDAVRARGLERNPIANLAPVIVHAIALAQATGDALVARGLDRDQEYGGEP